MKKYKSKLTGTILEYDKNGVVDEKKFIEIIKIVVPSEYAKKQLLTAFEYIHDLECIDSDYYAVNTLMHMYTIPFLIEVKPTDKRWHHSKKKLKEFAHYNG